MIIEVKNLQKSFIDSEKQIHVLSNLNFSIERGNSLAILGRSGSGKSTFLSLIAGLDLPDTGDIYIDNVNITEMNQDYKTQLRAKKIGFIFQQFHLIPHLTAFENIALPLEIAGVKNLSAKVTEMLQKVGLEDRKNHFPSQLSGGEKQRVALARAIINRPPIILADEPSGNLDEQTGNHVMNLIFNLVEEIKSTLVLVTHSQDLAMRCDQVQRLENGQLNKVN